MKKLTILLAICFTAIAGTAGAYENVTVKTQVTAASGALPVIAAPGVPAAAGSTGTAVVGEISPGITAAPQTSAKFDPGVKSDIFKATNAARVAALGSGKQLNQSTILDKAAAARVADMFKNQYFSHYSPDGSTVVVLVNQYGYRWRSLGENIARGTYSGGSQIVASWMRSPGHKANILSTKYSEIGIAAAYGNYKGRNQWIAVQVFGRPR
jgi:uncharacterized protein YkwD